MLHSLYTTFYYDDDGQPQVVMIHGETGSAHGPTYNSLKQAWETHKWIVIFAAVICVVGLALYLWGFVEPEAALVGIFIIVIGTGIGLWGLSPIARLKFSKRSSV